MKILLVDDDPGALEVLEEMIRRMGHQVTACFRVLFAKQIILDGEEFDVILTDNDMPEMSGVGFLRWFRAEHEPLCATTVYLMSGVESEEIGLLLREYPDIKFLSKPVSPETLAGLFGQ